jgi:hypothetical protein
MGVSGASAPPDLPTPIGVRTAEMIKASRMGEAYHEPVPLVFSHEIG